MRRFHGIVIGLSFLLLIGASAKAEVRQDGNELLRDCTANITGDSSDFFQAATCYGYLRGITDSRWFNKYFPDVRVVDCTPKGVTQGQIQDVVVKYLQAHPEELHYKNVVLVTFALKEAFPCKAQPAPK